MSSSRVLPCVLAALLLPVPSAAQVPEVRPAPPAAEGRPFTVGIGPGITTNLTRPGDWTATLTLSLGWSVDEHFTLTIAPYWEREFEAVGDAQAVYDELSIAVGATYSFAPRWAAGMDLDFGLVHDAFGPWERNPEFGIGVGVSYAFPLGECWNLVVGPEISWKISDDEWSLGLNSGVSFDF